MFFKKRDEKKSETVDKIFTDIELQRHKMPIVTLDNSWHQLAEKIKTPQIEELEKKLTELLKQQGKLNTDYIQYTKMKKNMLDTILELTHDAFELRSPNAIKKIEDTQKMILQINTEIEDMEKELDTLPKQIQEINGKLLEQTVNICYEYMNSYREQSQQLDEEIQVIRERLMEKTEIKKKYDESAGQLYKYLHQTVGPDFIEKLDRVYLEEFK